MEYKFWNDFIIRIMEANINFGQCHAKIYGVTTKQVSIEYTTFEHVENLNGMVRKDKLTPSKRHAEKRKRKKETGRSKSP